jgi:hypothetical protein
MRHSGQTGHNASMTVIKSSQDIPPVNTADSLARDWIERIAQVTGPAALHYFDH